MQTNHTPLKVEFTIRNGSPIREPKHLIHLDALLAFAAVERSMAKGAEDFSAQEKLPLDTITHKDAIHPVWAASALHYEPAMKELRYWSRKTIVESVARAQGDGYLRIRGDKLSTSSGPWKSYSEFEPLIHVRTLTAWCIGDKAQVEDLLADIRFIGKRRSKGYGEIATLTVSTDEAAHEKVKRRTLTWQEDDRYVPMLCGTKPPYFEKRPGFYPTNEVFENKPHISSLKRRCRGISKAGLN